MTLSEVVEILTDDQRAVIRAVLQRIKQHPMKQVRVANFSEMGTGKTLTEIVRMLLYKHQGATYGTLVMAPLNTLLQAWVGDLKRFAPELTWCFVSPSKSEPIHSLGIRTIPFQEAFTSEERYDVYLMYFDTPTLRFLRMCDHKNTLIRYEKQSRFARDMLKHIGALVIDEATAFAGHTSSRTSCLTVPLLPPEKRIKGARTPKDASVWPTEIIPKLKYISIMTGTPVRQNSLNVYAMMKVLDRGMSLGTDERVFIGRYMHYPEVKKVWMERPFKTASGATIMKRQSVDVSKPVDKPGIFPVIVKDIAKFNIVVRNVAKDLPPCHKTAKFYALDEHTQLIYDIARKDSLLYLDEGSFVEAVAKQALMEKLAQIAAGAVYDSNRMVHNVSDTRSELLYQSVKAHGKCIIFYRWKPQASNLFEYLTAKGLRVATLLGAGNLSARCAIAGDFQANNDHDVLLAHPQSLAHGVTVTNANAVIWPAIPYSLEHYLQANARIHRMGQTKTTYVHHVVASGTVDEIFFRLVTEQKFDNQEQFFKALWAEVRGAE